MNKIMNSEIKNIEKIKLKNSNVNFQSEILFTFAT